MKHKDKRVLMVRGGKFHYWPAEAQARREAQGWDKATAADVKGTGYELHITETAPAKPATEKGA